MSLARDPSLHGMTDCGCCDGVGVETPAVVDNRPGLSAVAYRVGTHATFKETMIAALSGGPGSVLRGLSAREDDFSVALLDAWAAVGDVLTFYQERIANESWLRTATERVSLIDLARAIGYELRPGLAASTWLAFTLDEAPGAPEAVTIAARTKVQSVPGPDEHPQTFETLDAFEARPTWNALRPRTGRPLLPEIGLKELYLEGVTTGLQPGDAVLIVGAKREADRGSEAWDFRRLTEVVPDRDAGVTRIAWEKGLGWRRWGHEVNPAKESVRVYVFNKKTGVFGSNAPDWRVMPDDVKKSFLGLASTDTLPAGHDDWPRFTLPEIRTTAGAPENTVHLDGLYPGIVQGSWVVLSISNDEEAYQVTATEEVAIADFTLTSKVAQLTLRGENLSTFDEHVRDLLVFGESDPLDLGEEPVRDAVEGDEVVLDDVVEGLQPGRLLLVRGLRARIRLAASARRLELMSDAGDVLRRLEREEVLTVLSVADVVGEPGSRRWQVRDERGIEGWVEARAGEFLPEAAPDDEEQVTEVVTLDEVTDDGLNTTLTFVDPLTSVYDRASTRVLANVAESTHGETVEEALGSGDASRPYLRFSLRDGPLTYVPAATPSGAESTLDVRVDDLLWKEVPNLYARGARERVYAVRRGDGGTTSVLFGDGSSGARPASGQENVRAVYRKGIGKVGNVKQEQLTLLMTRPLGVSRVTNPLPATGGTDPQALADARENAPLTVLTLDRIVSLQDYEDFAHSFEGVAKALAVWTWAGNGRGVFLTVAGPDGDAVPEGGPVQTRLIEAIREAGDALIPVDVRTYEPVVFRLSARVERDPAYLAEKVQAAVVDTLSSRFAFAERGFGQNVAASEVIAAIQDVPGVNAVDLSTLYVAGTDPAFQDLLQARAPRPGEDATAVLPAQLLMLQVDPGDIEVTS